MSTWLFARHELLALRRDPRAWAAAGCLLVLLIAAFAASEHLHRAYERTRVAAQDASHRQWLSQGTKNAHSAAHFGVYAFRPLPELAPFEPGLHGVLGTTIYLEAHKANDLRDAPKEDGSRLTYLDGSAAFLARTVVPLLLFLLVAASLAGERERGTLKMLQAQGSSVLRVALGKTLAFALLIVALVLFASLVALLASRVSALRVAALAVGYGLFALTMLCLAMAVSISAASSRRAVVSLFAVWTLSAVLGPRVAASAAAALAPMPLRSHVEAALAREIDDSGYERRTEALRARVLSQHGVQSVETLPFDFRGMALDYDETRGAAIFDRHRAQLRAHAARQDALLGGVSVLLPWLALEHWSTAVAGTDLNNAEHFADIAETYRRDLVGRMNRSILHAKGASGDEALWSTISAFQYVSPDTSFALRSAWPSLLILTLWAAVSFVFVLGLARRAESIGVEA